MSAATKDDFFGASNGEADLRRTIATITQDTSDRIH